MSSGLRVISLWMSHCDLKSNMFMKSLWITWEQKCASFLDFLTVTYAPILVVTLIHSSPSPSTSSQILSMFPIKYIYSIVTPFSSHCHHLISLPDQGYCYFFPICFTESKLLPHTIYPIMYTSQSPLNVISSYFPTHFTVALCFLVCLSASLFPEPSLVLPM